MLYIIGLGLGDEKDITVRGLEAINRCSKVYMEAYTSLLSFGLSGNGLSTLEKLYGKPITVADREIVEEKADDVLLEAQSSYVAFLVVGDPFGYIFLDKSPDAYKLLLLESVEPQYGIWLFPSDIRVKAPTLESLCRGKKVYEPPRLMSINTAIEQLLEVEQRRKESECTMKS